MEASVFNLWGEGFEIPDNTQNILNKIKSKKVTSNSPEKILKSKTVSFGEKLEVTTQQVNKILSGYKQKVKCIYSKEEFHEYVNKIIENGITAIDTETIGTRTDISKPGTDPFTCKIAGLCLHTPGELSTYIPINHVNYLTGERLPNQLTEEDVAIELKRMNDAHTFNIYHNGKFDYMVIYYTCGIKVPIMWDTMIGSQVLNENESASLKFQYRDKIDPDQEKYDINTLFDVNLNHYYPPEIFSLYAAPDPYMTYLLYEYQRSIFKQPGNENMYRLFYDIEMPVVEVTAEMEMRGFAVDKEFAKRLSNKFHTKLDSLNNVIDNELSKYDDLIQQWRLSPEANTKPIVNGKQQKSLAEKLENPISLTSNIQLGILLYDILHILKKPKDGTMPVDEATLLTIKDKLPLASMILTKREYEKYLGTYIDVLPTYCNPRDGRVHAHFNQMGREDKNVVTGRMSSSDPNLQNIPARGDITSVRCMFMATTNYQDFEKTSNFYEVPIENEVLLSSGEYKFSSLLEIGDILENNEKVDKVEVKDKLVYIYTT